MIVRFTSVFCVPTSNLCKTSDYFYVHPGDSSFLKTGSKSLFPKNLSFMVEMDKEMDFTGHLVVVRETTLKSRHFTL